MEFKKRKLGVGDIVALQTSVLPIPEVSAAVIRVEGGVLEVLSTFLVPFNHNGIFTESDVDRIEVIYPAEVAIPKESRGKGFSKGQYVRVNVEGVGSQGGRVVAAFDGIVVAQREDGELITAGASFFEEILKWELIDMKLMSIGPINELMKVAKITKEDVKNFFVMDKDGKRGQVMTHEEMYALEIDEIGGWSRISRFDVNC